MGKRNKAPKAPSFKNLTRMVEASAAQSYQLGQEQLAWAREQYAGDREILDRVVNASLERQGVNDANAAEDRARYENTFQPLENELIADARSYASPERQEYEAGRASSEVAQNFEMARQNATRNLESFGVNPASTRFAALDLGARVQQAAAQAGAANQARGETEAIGRELRGQAIDIGRALPGQVAGTYATSLQSGASGVNSQLAGTASGASTMGTGTQWTGLGTGAVQTGANVKGTQAQANNATFEANQNASSGLGGLLGTGLGIASNMGWALADGGEVPAAASPTRGKAIDDVPARLTAGEFVVPQDVVSWKGEEFFQRLIEGARKAKPQATAKPSFSTVPSAPPSFVSRSSGALPVG
jgi:hypothetical protein